MADDQGEVVIRDEQGTEHVFPSGFDPQRAAAIVRGQTPIAQPTAADLLAGRMLSHDAPEDPLKTALRGAAYPTSVTDALTYIVPSVGEGASPYLASAANEARQASTRLRQIPGQMLRVLYNRATDTRTNPEIAQEGFNKLPLALQMERLPQTGPMPTTARMSLRPIGQQEGPTIQGVSIADLKKAGVRDAAINATLREAGAANRAVNAPYGNGGVMHESVGPMEAQIPVNAPRPAVTPQASTEGPTAFDQIREGKFGYQPQTATVPKSDPATAAYERILAGQPNAAETPISQPLGQPRVMTLKPTPTSWTPEAARARIEMNDWHSGAEPGSLEAKQAGALHREAGDMESRYKFLLSNPNAAVALGVPAAMRAALLSRWGGAEAQQ